MEKIKYKDGYKYQLYENYEIQTNICPSIPIFSSYIKLQPDGLLTIYYGYAWDGPSGPTIDTKNFMRGSLVHDALYQLMREGHLPHSEKVKADILLRNICIEDGMCKLRAWWVYKGVKDWADYATLPKNEKKILEAP